MHCLKFAFPLAAILLVSTSVSRAETRVESENWFMRFFGEGDQTLHDALVGRGVNEADARASRTLPAHSAILTVDGANHPELAAQLLSEYGGQLITQGFGATGYGTVGTYGAATAELSGAPVSRTTSLDDDGAYDDDETLIGESTYASDSTSYDDYGRYRAGSPVDESTRLQLREERLRVDKSRISSGETGLEPETFTERHETDVPLMREEVFIERLPAGGAASVDDRSTSERNVVRAPLSQEEVNVTKVPVVTEEVVAGNRQADSSEQVSAASNKDRLDATAVDPMVRAGGMRDPRI